MGSTAFFEVSYGFVLRKGTLEMLRAMEVEKLRFFFKSEKLFVRKQKALIVFP